MAQRTTRSPPDQDNVEISSPSVRASPTRNNEDIGIKSDGEYLENIAPDITSRDRTTVTLCILTTEMFERLAFYSVSANMVLYCTSKLGFSTVDATTISLVFSALANLFPVLGGYVADSWTGRHRTIIVSVLLNILAMMFIQTSSIEFDTWFDVDLNETAKRSFYLTGLLVLTLGTGGIKANISPFGAEQLETLGKEAVQSFFNWFYWVINAGALIAYSGVAYLQQNESFTWGMFIPLMVTVMELIVFLVPYRMYVKSRAKGSVITTTFRILRQGCCKGPPHPNPNLPDGTERQFLARAKKSFGGDTSDVTVDGLVRVIAVLPFCFLVIIYYTVYSQTTSSFFVQSERMDVSLGPVQIPAAMLNTVGNISIIVLIPIIDRFFYPCMKKIGLPLSHLKRIGFGMILSLLAVVIAGIVEIYRKDVMHQPGGSHVQVLANENFTASSLSVFAQVPQFALIGASEIFTSVTCLEFAYTQAPVSLQGLVTGFFLAAWGFGNLLSMGILLIVEEATQSDPWYGDEINNLRMENLMFLLAGLMAVNFLVFCGAAHVYRAMPTGTDSVDSSSSSETGMDSKQQIFYTSTSDTAVTGCYSASDCSRENILPIDSTPIGGISKNITTSQTTLIDSIRENIGLSKFASDNSTRENVVSGQFESQNQLVFVRL